MADQKAKLTARWRKEPDEKGLARAFQNTRGLELREGAKVVLRVAYNRDKLGHGREGWYWYGLGKNTCQELCATQEEAKAQADAHYKACKQSQEVSS